MLKFRTSIILLALLFTSFVFAQSPATRRGLLPTDLSAIKDVSDAQISPDGSRIVYVVSETTPDRVRTISRLWIVPTSGGESKRLTPGEASESTPRWSPDGNWVAFYSSRDGRDGLWVVPATGGEPKLATHVFRTNFFLTKAGESFTWAPDSKRIAFLSSIEVLSDAPATTAANTPAPAGLPAAATRPLSREDIEKLPVEVREMLFRAQGQAMGQRPQSPIENAISPIPDDPRVITRLQYKSRASFSDNLQSHIFEVDLEKRQVRQLTTGLYYEHSINWSPKGDEIVFVSNREPDPDKVNNTDLFVVNVNTFAIRQLTKTKGCEWQPVFSPDGSEIAYIATKREITTIDSVAEDSHIYVIPTEGGVAQDWIRELDRRAFSVKWSPASGDLIFTASNHGKTLLYRAKKSGEVAPIYNRDAQITSFSIATKAPHTPIVFTFSEPGAPSQIHGMTHKGEPLRFRPANDALLSSLIFSQPREFTFKNDDFDVEGWLVPPPNLDETKKYPVILNIHGGPHGMHGYGFNPNVQAMAAHGYAVLLINPRGSSGYGQKFTDGCINDWGGGDFRDLMKGVDEALARWSFLDKNRLGVMGGSYGGYMTNWVVTQTDRFRAAVASASISNMISFYATSLYQDLVHAEFNGFPWNNFELLWERSPIKHAAKAKTPLLLIHGEQDNDVHITQAEEMFTAMRMRGIDAVFVRYPREGHGLREPRHREDSLARTLQWFDRYLKQ